MQFHYSQQFNINELVLNILMPKCTSNYIYSVSIYYFFYNIFLDNLCILPHMIQAIICTYVRTKKKIIINIYQMINSLNIFLCVTKLSDITFFPALMKSKNQQYNINCWLKANNKVGNPSTFGVLWWHSPPQNTL